MGYRNSCPVKMRQGHQKDDDGCAALKKGCMVLTYRRASCFLRVRRAGIRAQTGTPVATSACVRDCGWGYALADWPAAQRRRHLNIHLILRRRVKHGALLSV